MTVAHQAVAPASPSQVAAVRIRGLRAERGWNQAELGLRSGLSRSAISDRESGRKDVDVDELPVLASTLGVSVAYLMGFTDDRSRPLEEAASEFVRHQGLEPRTRWFGASRRQAEVIERGDIATITDLRTRSRRPVADVPAEARTPYRGVQGSSPCESARHLTLVQIGDAS